MNIYYDILHEEHVTMFRNLRLELLQTNPTSFGSSFEEESQFDDNRFIKRLRNPNTTTFGAFDNEQLIGMCVVVRNPRQKMKHRVTLNSMYVKSNYRKKGIAKGLLDYVFSNLDKEEIEMMCLTVVSDNHPAIALYKSLGFQEGGYEKSAIKYMDTYYDLLLMHKFFSNEND